MPRLSFTAVSTWALHKAALPCSLAAVARAQAAAALLTGRMLRPCRRQLYWARSTSAVAQRTCAGASVLAAPCQLSSPHSQELQIMCRSATGTEPCQRWFAGSANTFAGSANTCEPFTGSRLRAGNAQGQLLQIGSAILV